MIKNIIAMKKIFLLVSVAGLVFLTQSCEKFLDLKPVNSATTGNSYQRPADIEAALVACYNILHQTEFYTWDYMLQEDVRSDNCYAGPPDDVDIFEYDMIKLTASNVRLKWNWGDLYKGISRCNLVLEKIDGISGLSEARHKEIVGEARFLRAYYYFDLVKQFGGVPIVSQEQTADPDKIQIPRNTETEVYDYIVEDLNAAVELLPDMFSGGNSVNKARATKGTAYAVLAKVWAQRPDRDYNKVIEYCDKVINSPAGYMLLPDFRLLFDGNHYNNDESIFEAQYIGGGEHGNWGPQLLLPPSLTNDDWRKYATPSTNMIKAFDDENDTIRKNASIIWEVVDWVDEYWSTLDHPGPVPFAYKMKHADGWNSGDHLYLIRFADILLLKAEALANLNQGDKGRSIVNQIRARVNLPPTTASDAEMLDAILHERRLELFLEGQRWSDLRRYGKVQTTMNSLKELNLITGKYVEYNVDEHDLIMPIPLNEIDRNPKLIQNPGY